MGGSVLSVCVEKQTRSILGQKEHVGDRIMVRAVCDIGFFIPMAVNGFSTVAGRGSFMAMQLTLTIFAA